MSTFTYQTRTLIRSPWFWALIAAAMFLGEYAPEFFGGL